MKINYSLVVTKDFKSKISEEKYQELKKLAEPCRNTLLAKHTCDNIPDYSLISKRAYEVTYPQSKFKDRNRYEQAIISSYMFYSNNERFAEILKNGGFDRDSLENLLNSLEYIINKKATYGLNDMDKEYEKKCNKLILQIDRQITKYLGKIEHGELIINKISEILSYQPELLEINTVTKSKKR